MRFKDVLANSGVSALWSTKVNSIIGIPASSINHSGMKIFGIFGSVLKVLFHTDVIKQCSEA